MRGKRDAELVGRQHPVECLVQLRSGGEMLLRRTRRAAAHQRAVRPVMPGGGQLDVRCARCGAGKGLGCERARPQPPCRQPLDPAALGHPFARTIGRCARQFQRGGIVVLDVIAPRDPLAPFGASIARKLPVGLAQQAVGFGGIVALDRLEDCAGGGAGHRPVIDAARQDPLGGIGLAREALLARQRGEIGDPALRAHPRELFGLRQIGTGVEPCGDLLGRDLGAIGVGVELGAGGLGEHTIGALGEQAFDLGPLLGIDRGEQLAVALALLGREHGCQRAIDRSRAVPARHQIARLRRSGRRQRERRQHGCRHRPAPELPNALHSVADHSIHLRQNRAFSRGMSIRASSVSLINTGTLPPA